MITSSSMISTRFTVNSSKRTDLKQQKT